MRVRSNGQRDEGKRQPTVTGFRHRPLCEVICLVHGNLSSQYWMMSSAAVMPILYMASLLARAGMGVDAGDLDEAIRIAERIPPAK